MSLNSGSSTLTADSRNAPTMLVNPSAGEAWNWVDVAKDAGIDAEITFDSGRTWLPFPSAKTGWSGPFPKSSRYVAVRPKVDGQVVAGLIGLARAITYPQ